MNTGPKTEMPPDTEPLLVPWFKNGDHPKDNVFRPFEDTGAVPTEPREGAVVRYFRHPQLPGGTICKGCSSTLHEHGWLDNGGEGQTVCPGSWIVKRADGRYMSLNRITHTLLLPKPFALVREVNEYTHICAELAWQLGYRLGECQEACSEMFGFDLKEVNNQPTDRTMWFHFETNTVSVEGAHDANGPKYKQVYKLNIKLTKIESESLP